MESSRLVKTADQMQLRPFEVQGCQITWTYFDKIIFNIVHKCKSQLGKKQQQQQHTCTHADMMAICELP